MLFHIASCHNTYINNSLRQEEKRMKRKVILMAAAAMVVSMCGCHGGGKEAVKQSDGDHVITFWNIGTEDPDASIMKYAVEQYNKYESPKSGYTIEMTAIQNDKYKEKLVIAMSSGECPDMYTSWSGGPLQEYIDSGFAQPVTKLYEESGLADRYVKAATAQATFGGEIYAVPILNMSVSGVFYNKEIFDKYNLKEPKTIAELEQIARTLKQNGVIPFALANSAKWQGDMFFQGFATRYAGLDDFRKAYDGSGTFDAPCFTYAGEKIREWAQDGFFPDGMNSLSSDDGQDRQLMYQGKAAMLYSGSWYTGTFQADSKEFYEKVGWFPFPQCDESPKGAEYINICNGTIGDQFVSFNCKDEKLKEAMKCVAYYSSEEAVALMVDKGKIPPVAGVEAKLTDPLTKEICAYAQNAADVQLWYDQYLPASVATAHLDACQELFGLTMEPKEANEKAQQAMSAYLQERK